MSSFAVNLAQELGVPHSDRGHRGYEPWWRLWQD